MKKWIAGLFLFASLAQADAADLNYGYRQQQYAPPPVQVYRWTGPYIGANLGYQWGSVSNNPTEPSGVMGGIQAGYNWQFDNFVLGAETDFNFTGADDTFAPWKFSNPWFGTLRARVGFTPVNNLLIYGTGGLAYGRVEAQNWGWTESSTRVGWTLGAGAEVALTQAWSAKFEYLYVSLNDRFYAVTGTNNGLDNHVLRFGVNYRF